MLNPSIPKQRRQDGMSQLWAAGGRILLWITAALLIITPWTEYFCHPDAFLQGGPDLELGLLSLISILCLVLLMLQHNKRGVDLILAVRRWLVFIFHPEDPRLPGSLTGLIAGLHAIIVPSPALDRYTLPLQI